MKERKRSSPRKGLRRELRPRELPRREFRRLEDLAGVGPATIADLAMLGVRSVEQLAERDGKDLYERLCAATKVRHDPCCLDVFRCAVAQAQDPRLPAEQCNWWYWSELRKKSARKIYGSIHER